MVNSNKVLTVSYGTFSCTLEGFEDSFDTMKAIAEYFRDLAADDRYFGAEPPQPDADMLARIAQREIARQVEARQGESGIVLRASDASQPPAVVAEAGVASSAGVEEQAVEITQIPEQGPATVSAPIEDREKVDQPVVTDAPVEPAEAIAETVVAETVVAETIVDEPAAQDSVVSPDLASEPIQAEVIGESLTEDDNNAVDLIVDEITPDTVDETPEEIVAAEPETEVVAEPVEKAPAQPAADSIAAKLQRIRAVVARNDALAHQDEYTEDLQAADFTATEAAEISDALDVEDLVDTEADEDDAEDTIGAVLGQLDVDSDDVQDDTQDDVAEISESEDDSLFADLEAAQAAPADEAQEDDDVANILEAVAEAEPEAEKPEDVAAETSRKLRRVRVKKIKRVDLDQAIAEGMIEPVADDTPSEIEILSEAEADGATQASTLSDEAEADLMRELAEVEAEFAPAQDMPEPSLDTLGEDTQEPETDAKDAPLVLQPAQKDADLSRLMDEAGVKMDDPETASKAEAFQNLRAAVAATEADKETGGDLGQETQDDAYRSDLAQVVKPRRPALSAPSATRPKRESKPAPLKLVAEQRVDEITEVKSAAPVTPRRVAAPVEPAEVESNDEQFVAFIGEMEVHNLVELMEASASFMGNVEGREKFSRPQLMNKVRLVHEGEFNREDGLRAFGQLLREGKLLKAGGGRFSASGEIGFQPQARAAG